MSARSCSTKGHSGTKRAKHLPPRPRRVGEIPLWTPSAFICARHGPHMCPPAVSLHIFPIRPRLLVASLRPSHFGTSAYVSRRMTSEAQKEVLARCARLRRPDEPTEPVARRRDRRPNPLRPLRKSHLSCEPRVLMHKRAPSLGRTPLGTRQDRHVDFIAGRDRQEMGEDGGLFAVGEVRNDESIAGKRLRSKTSVPV
jgi:hypothetical protein